MEDNGADLMNHGGSFKRIHRKNFSMLPKDCTCDILVKNVATFYPCLKSLPEAKVKIF